jgi:UDP-N-acetylglucosamine--N-acetylmuramyl-(pentapeptide) pyrophosphoryl-undecaprenol N-acetylglucosamine transferase
MIERVILAGGGTGGHLFPGIAVLEELKRREPDVAALFVGTARGLETRVVPELGEQLECIDVAPLRGRSMAEFAKNLLALPKAGAQAAKIVRRFAPDVVIGVGGYAAGPMVAAAKALGVPTVLLEQNAHVGLTNRLLARLVDRAYLSFEETASVFPDAAARVVGNPVRRKFVSAGRMARMDPAGFEMRARKVLVIGGSQGARALNEQVPEALARAGLRERGIEVVHQTGHASCDAVRARYHELGLQADVTPFIADMASAYAASALVIGRAGATSLAEICAVGRPSILVPFPFAAGDHQWHNAKALETRGAAVALREADGLRDALAEAVMRLLSHPDERLAMADAARALGRPEAAAAIVDDLCSFLGCAVPEGTDDQDDDSELVGETKADRASTGQALRALVSYPPSSRERLARRHVRRRSVAWSQPDRYYGTRAVASAE